MAKGTPHPKFAKLPKGGYPEGSKKDLAMEKIWAKSRRKGKSKSKK